MLERYKWWSLATHLPEPGVSANDITQMAAGTTSILLWSQKKDLRRFQEKKLYSKWDSLRTQEQKQMAQKFFKNQTFQRENIGNHPFFSFQPLDTRKLTWERENNHLKIYLWDLPGIYPPPSNSGIFAGFIRTVSMKIQKWWFSIANIAMLVHWRVVLKECIYFPSLPPPLLLTSVASVLQVSWPVVTRYPTSSNSKHPDFSTKCHLEKKNIHGFFLSKQKN